MCCSAQQQANVRLGDKLSIMSSQIHPLRTFMLCADDERTCALRANFWTTINTITIQCRRQPGPSGVHVLCFPQLNGLACIVPNAGLPHDLDDVHKRRTSASMTAANPP